ncbi:MAG: uroporphyrinogen-III synthase [Hyphomicrobiales bacterium]|nr:uroporphyrinogen-III synthase [Hyphomicrobiales bacterium]MDE2113908.1 uroporphyrinogen-III synthase [Hyphomicrobiales bacterium]
MQVLVTRPLKEAQATAIRLEALGFAPILSPVLEIAAIPVRLPESLYDAVLVTSANAFVAPIEGAAPLAFHTVGEHTALAAQQAGWPAPKSVATSAKDLIGQLTHQYPHPSRFLYLAGRDRKSDLETALRARGHEIEIVVSYHAIAAHGFSDEASRMLAASAHGCVLHYSRRSAGIFTKLIQSAGLMQAAARVHHLCLSADVATPLARLAGVSPIIADAPNEAALFDQLTRLQSRLQSRPD